MNAAVDFAMPWKRRTEREQNAQREAERLLDETKKLFEKTSNHPVFQAASEPGLTRLMLESAGEDLLRGLSHAFDQAETARAASHPLNGARNALRLAAYLRLGFLRARFVSFLASAPALDNPRAISARNGEALRVLLEVATREAIPLGDAWKAVLTAVSQLQQLRLLVSSLQLESHLSLGVSFIRRVALFLDCRGHPKQTQRLSFQSTRRKHPPWWSLKACWGRARRKRNGARGSRNVCLLDHQCLTRSLLALWNYNTRPATCSFRLKSWST